MKKMPRTGLGSRPRTAGIAIFSALIFIAGIMIMRHNTLIAASQYSATSSATVSALPDLSKILQHQGRATLSLDAITINGKSTVVAGLTARRIFRVKPTDTIQLTGWAFDPGAAAPAGGLLVRYGARDLHAAYGLVRPDVASAYKLPDLTLVGFNALVGGRKLRPGANLVSLLVISHDLKSYYVNPSEVILDLHKS